MIKILSGIKLHVHSLPGNGVYNGRTHSQEGVPTKIYTSKMVESRATKREKAECMLVVSNFHFRNVSFSDELSFCEKSDKPKVILPVDLRHSGLGDI